MGNIEQAAARYAWGRVKGVSTNTLKAYKNLAKSVPALVTTNGLMQVLAFLKGKAKDREEHQRLLDDLLGWLHETRTLPVQHGGFQQAMQWFVSEACTPVAYQQTTEQALAVLTWIRYFSDALDNGG